jgi:GNAT superfamily N-acetyltransferase
MPMGDVATRSLAVNQAFLALGNERFEAEGATFIRNGTIPEIRDANHVTQITASTPAEIDRLLARVEREFAGFPHHRFDVDFTTPPSLEARLALEGYERDGALVMLLDGELAGAPKRHDIRPITGDEAWQAFGALQDLSWREYTSGAGRPYEENVPRGLTQSNRSKSPPARYWLAYVDGRARAYCASWVGIEGVGQVEELFTYPDFRHRGLATALIHHCVSACRAEGSGPIVIVADPSGTAMRMYAAMGFRPVAMKSNYWKTSLGKERQP